MPYAAVRCACCGAYQVQVCVAGGARGGGCRGGGADTPRLNCPPSPLPTQAAKQKPRFACVVCGEKQALQRTYATAAKAADVRPGVQALNAGRDDEAAAAQAAVVAAPPPPPPRARSPSSPSRWADFEPPPRAEAAAAHFSGWGDDGGGRSPPDYDSDEGSSYSVTSEDTGGSLSSDGASPFCKGGARLDAWGL